jgi:hypothetical protein
MNGCERFKARATTSQPSMENSTRMSVHSAPERVRIPVTFQPTLLPIFEVALLKARPVAATLTPFDHPVSVTV